MSATPGPWSYDLETDGAIRSEGGAPIAFLTVLCKEEDARLLAAAPDLLAALQDIVFNSSIGADVTRMTAVERARAAITKATAIGYLRYLK